MKQIMQIFKNSFLAVPLWGHVDGLAPFTPTGQYRQDASPTDINAYQLNSWPIAENLVEVGSSLAEISGVL